MYGSSHARARGPSPPRGARVELVTARPLRACSRVWLVEDDVPAPPGSTVFRAYQRRSAGRVTAHQHDVWPQEFLPQPVAEFAVTSEGAGAARPAGVGEKSERIRTVARGSPASREAPASRGSGARWPPTPTLLLLPLRHLAADVPVSWITRGSRRAAWTGRRGWCLQRLEQLAVAVGGSATVGRARSARWARTRGFRGWGFFFAMSSERLKSAAGVAWTLKMSEDQ